MMRYRLHIIACALTLVTMACGNATQQSDDTPTTANSTADVIALDEPEDEEPTGNPAEAEYIVISKESMTLRLYDSSDALICRFNVATGKYAGNKQRPGDMKTPEGEFIIEEIVPSAHWTHDFGDGKGVIEGCYGNWFIRLKTPPHKGIGIHGTHDPQSIGTRATEGCIRLNNNDLDSIKPMLRAGMSVTIKPGRLDYEADGVAIPLQHPIEPSQPQPVETQDAETTTLTETVEPQIAEPQVVEAQSVAPQATEPQAVPTAEAEVKDEDEELWHTVVDGDLVGRIAQYYGTTTAEIRRLNPDINIDRISIGQRIKVRGTAPATTAPKEPAIDSISKSEAATTNGDEEVWYTVVDGDLVGRIAARYGTTSKRIAELNPDINIDRISIGQRIRVK